MTHPQPSPKSRRIANWPRCVKNLMMPPRRLLERRRRFHRPPPSLPIEKSLGASRAGGRRCRVEIARRPARFLVGGAHPTRLTPRDLQADGAEPVVEHGETKTRETAFTERTPTL